MAAKVVTPKPVKPAKTAATSAAGTRLLECHGIAIATMSVSTASDAARYLLCQTRLTWPTAFIEDKAGEQYSHHSHALPAKFTIYADESEVPTGRTRSRPATPAIGVAINGRSIELAFNPAAHPIALAVAEALAADPIWGPLWAPPVTRYMA